MSTSLIVVEGYAPTASDDTNVRDQLYSLALEQRLFGPRKLWVAFADLDGTFHGLAYTDRLDPLEYSFAACLDYLGDGAARAVAYCDEQVQHGPPPPELTARFLTMQAIAAEHGIRLVDWIACDDDLFRSTAWPKACWDEDL